jgi:hypothetical protein
LSIRMLDGALPPVWAPAGIASASPSSNAGTKARESLRRGGMVLLQKWLSFVEGAA